MSPTVLSGSGDESGKQSSKETSKRKRDFEDNTKGIIIFINVKCTAACDYNR